MENVRKRSKKENFIITRNNNYQIEGDYYATPPEITKAILRKESLNGLIHEPCCGEGHISRILEENGLNVFSSDLIDRGYGYQEDFLESNFKSDIVFTNPPFIIIDAIIDKAKLLAARKVIIIASTNILKGKRRVKKFTSDHEYPLSKVYMMDTSINYYKNGVKPEKRTGFMTSCVLIFDKEHNRYNGIGFDFLEV
ncbi:hypothetical protein PFY12_14420 [Chryseobacterium camelliae]|uniref:SAM-dependent methyltransferase n=1 Tax=Chryseobacterium camelliae TaxID=1265445 RepID=A0ABY7QLJ9_9FLAO|nr:hypothetical protein [Chryseobacterium camelliae]WBV60219.1 hypothetical protein PFY12_14420 [Chryseobacterium camelliae]